MRNVFSTGRLAFVLAVAIATSACGKSSSSSSGSSTTTSGVNVYGQVSQSTTVSFEPAAQTERLGSYGIMSLFTKPSRKKPVDALAVSGCTVTAYDLLTNAQVGTATSAADGTYTLKGDAMVAGTSYKIVAVCGASESYTLVAKADSTAAADKDPVVTSPISTIIAAKVMQAVLSAIESATTGLSADVATVLKAAVLKTMDSVIASLTSTINDAIKSGAMEPPTVTEAATMSTSLASTTTAAAANTATTTFETTKPMPATVDAAVEGAKSQVSSLADCDNTISGKTVLTCTRAVAKILYSGLNFGVALDMSSAGAFHAEFAGACDATNTALTDIFLNPTFDTGTAGFCILKPSLGSVDRNRGDERGGGDDHMYFAEDGLAAGKKGLLTRLGTALYNKHVFLLSDIDKIVFTKSGSGATLAGLNARLFNIADANGAAGSLVDPVIKYKNGAGNWVAITTGTYTDSADYCTTAGNPCNVTPTANSGGDHMNFPFATSATDWDHTQLKGTITSLGTPTVASIVDLVNSGSFSGSFYKMFGGELPSLAQLDGALDDRTHLNNNPTGNKKQWVIYAERPQHTNGSADPCNDTASNSPCLGVSGTQYPALRINVTLSNVAAAAGSPVRNITAISVSSTGAWVIRPFFASTGFTGVLGLTKVADGSIGLNEINQERGLRVITNVSQCGAGNKLPNAGAGTCAVGDIFNANIDWSNCSGGSNCPAWSGLGTSVPRVTGLSLANYVENNVRMTQVFVGNNQLWVAGTGDFGSMSPVRVDVTPGAGTDALTPNLSSGAFYVTPRFAGTPVVFQNDFYLTNVATGAVRVAANDSDSLTNTSVGVCGVVSSSVTCSGQNAVTYTLTYMDGLNWGSSATLSDIAMNKWIFSGPFLNPNFACDKEPFFIDGNGDGVLNCDPADPTSVLSSSNDISFSSNMDYNQWYSNPNNASNTHHSSPLISRQNGYAFGDPAGAKKLLTTAFNGWFDGTHTLTATTQLDALQGFSLIYLMFSQHGGVHMTKDTGLTSDRFILSMPADNSPTGPLIINHMFANGFATFKQ